MKYSDEKVEKLIEFVAKQEFPYCPSDIGLNNKDDGACNYECKDCWQQALAGDD